MERNAWGGRLRRDDAAVTEVLGSILLVGMTIIAAAGLAIATTQVLKPPQHLFVDLVATATVTDPLAPTAEIRLTHVGGDALDRAKTWIDLGHPLAPPRIGGADLLDGFGDGTFTLGELWIHSGAYAACDVVRIVVVAEHDDGGAQLILGDDLLVDDGACGGGP